MSDPDFYLSQGDTSPAIEATLHHAELDDDGELVPIDLTGATVGFVLRPSGSKVSDTAGVIRAAEIVTPLEGKVRYQWVAADTAVPGRFDADWIVIFPGLGQVETHRNDRYLTITIKRALYAVNGVVPPVVSIVTPLSGYGGAPPPVALASSAGVLGTASRADHTHQSNLLEVDGISTGATQLATLVPPATGHVRAWAKSVRRLFYLDRTSTATAVAGEIVVATGGGRWIAIPVGDVIWQQQAEWWHGAAGTLEAIGTRAAPINSVAELVRRVGNGGTTDSVLYHAAALSDQDSALFDGMRTHSPKAWTIVDGALPAVVKLMYLMSDFDGLGLGNPTLVPGQSLAGRTWKCLGNVGAAGDLTATGNPIYNGVASVGDLRDSPSVRFDGSSWFRSGIIPGLVAPITWVVIAKIDNPAALNNIVDGRDGSNRGAIQTISNVWALHAGQQVNTVAPGPVAGVYHYVYATINDNAAVFAVNEDAAPAPVNAGAQMVTGVTIGAGGDDSGAMTGEVVAVLGLDGADNLAEHYAMFNDWMRYRYGGYGWPQ